MAMNGVALYNSSTKEASAKGVDRSGPCDLILLQNGAKALPIIGFRFIRLASQAPSFEFWAYRFHSFLGNRGNDSTKSQLG